MPGVSPSHLGEKGLDRQPPLNLEIQDADVTVLRPPIWSWFYLLCVLLFNPLPQLPRKL